MGSATALAVKIFISLAGASYKQVIWWHQTPFPFPSLPLSFLSLLSPPFSFLTSLPLVRSRPLIAARGSPAVRAEHDRQMVNLRYDTIGSLTWTRKLSIQLYLAHVARKKETKTNKRQCPFHTVQVKICEGSPDREGIRVTIYGGKDLWKKWVLSLECKIEAVIGDESEGPLSDRF